MEQANQKVLVNGLQKLASGFNALRVRNYRIYWFGELISLTGNWMHLSAQAWLVLQITSSPLAVGAFAIFQFLPITLLSLFSGVFADRYPKQYLILLTQTLSLTVTLTFGILVATNAIQIWQVYLLAFIQGCINAIDNPTRHAFIAELTPKDYMANAITLDSLLFQVTRIIGPAITGILIASIGTSQVFFINAITFLISNAGIMLMNKAEFVKAASQSKQPIKVQLREGFSYIKKTPSVLLVLLVVAAIAIFGYNLSVILSYVAGFLLNTNSVGFGTLGTFLGAGSVAAALLTSYTNKPSFKFMFAMASMFALILGGIALSKIFILSAFLLLCLGLSGVLFNNTAKTLLQLQVPYELRGRVMSVYVVLFTGSTPVGGLFIGLVSNALTAQAALIICAAICLLGMGCAFIYYRKLGIQPQFAS